MDLNNRAFREGINEEIKAPVIEQAPVEPLPLTNPELPRIEPVPSAQIEQNIQDIVNDYRVNLEPYQPIGMEDQIRV